MRIIFACNNNWKQFVNEAKSPYLFKTTSIYQLDIKIVNPRNLLVESVIQFASLYLRQVDWKQILDQ